MKRRQPGRPPRDQAPVRPEALVSAALELLNAKGVEAFTMRALAARLRVNPMTIYHHFGDRDGLIRALSEKVYQHVAAPTSGGVRIRIEGLLRAYHAQVLRHPGLTLLIFSRPAVFPEQARRITEDLAALLREARLSSTRSRLWVNLLVDFTHGAALATTMGDQSVRDGEATGDGYDEALAELLDALERSL
jgi:AcrR family transcriptional regulator